MRYILLATEKSLYWRIRTKANIWVLHRKCSKELAGEIFLKKLPAKLMEWGEQKIKRFGEKNHKKTQRKIRKKPYCYKRTYCIREVWFFSSFLMCSLIEGIFFRVHSNLHLSILRTSSQGCVLCSCWRCTGELHNGSSARHPLQCICMRTWRGQRIDEWRFRSKVQSFDE